MRDFFENLPAILAASAQTELGVIALIIVVLGFLAVIFFYNAPWRIRIPMFLALVAGYFLLAYLSAPNNDPKADPQEKTALKNNNPNADLQGKTAFQLDVMRNEYFARHGRFFCRTDLQDYFKSKAWYKPSICPDDFNTNLLSSEENLDIARILNYQKSTGKVSTEKNSDCRTTLPNCTR